MRTKHCKRCDRTIDIIEFHRSKHSKDGHVFYCKECVAKMGKKYRHTADGIYSNAKNRQTYYKKNDHPGAKPFLIERDWFRQWHDKQDKTCIYCAIPEEHCKLVTDEFGVHGEQLTLDCVNNDKGYTTDNIVLACHRCNNTKSVLFSFQEMYEIGQQYIRPKWEKIVREHHG